MHIKMLINGHLTDAKSGKVMQSINPSNEEVLGTSPLASKEDIELAFASSAEAFKSWSTSTVEERAHAVRKVAQGLRERAKDIVAIEALDTGNTMPIVLEDVERSAELLEYYAGLGYEMTGKTILTPNNLHLTVREPYGVCARIVPFNHPTLFISKIGAPLMAGNTIIVKPAEQAPLSSGIFAEILKQSVPPGVVNLVTGDAATGEAIVLHPQILRVAFTGSVSTGLKIQSAVAASGKVKHVSMEMGGKNAMLLFPDADLDKAVKGVIKGMGFAWQGQSCGSTSRLLVHDSIYDQIVEKVVDQVSRIKVGLPTDIDTGMGPIISKQQYDKVLSYIKIGQEEGAHLAYGGVRPKGMDKGYWLMPTVFTNVTPNMRIAREEIFGPVLSIMKFKSEEEALYIANDVEYGLTGAVWTNDLNRAIRLSRKLECGYVWVNETAVHYHQMPFGGYKQSSLGREEGFEELLEYTRLKSIHIIS